MLSVPTGFAEGPETEARRGDPCQPQEEVQGEWALVTIHLVELEPQIVCLPCFPAGLIPELAFDFPRNLSAHKYHNELLANRVMLRSSDLNLNWELMGSLVHIIHFTHEWVTQVPRAEELKMENGLTTDNQVPRARPLPISHLHRMAGGTDTIQI